MEKEMEASAEVGHCFLHSEKFFSGDELEARMSSPHHGSRLGWGENCTTYITDRSGREGDACAPCICLFVVHMMYSSTDTLLFLLIFQSKVKVR